MTKLDEIKKSKKETGKSNFLNKIFIAIGLLVIVLLIAAGVMIFLPKPISNKQAALLAQCLSSKGIKMYGAYWCHECEKQKKLFGDASQFIQYVECQLSEDEANQECLNLGIEKFPTWIINGEKYTGKRPLQELAELSGCSLEEDAKQLA